MFPSMSELGKITSVAVMDDRRRNHQVAINSARVKRRLQDGQEAHGRRAVLACYGPSLKKTLPLIASDSKHDPNADVVCVGSSHKMLVDAGIIPYACIDCDPRQRNVDQLGEPHPWVRYWLASCVDPSYTAKLAEFDVSLWHIHNGSASEEFVWSIEPDAWLLIGGGSVGLRSISLLYAMGYRSFDIHGMDSSYSDDVEHAGTHLAPPRKPDQILRVQCNDRWFTTNLSLADYARQFLDDQRLWEGAVFRIHGDGLLQEMCKSAAQQQRAA